jgi:ATP-dependent RNA helicase RhlE
MKKKTFAQLGLIKALQQAIETEGYTKPYPIQKKAIPTILKGHDVLGIAKTGSGKTASYVLPILNNLQGKTKTKNRHVSVLVMVPTRELAVQVAGVFQLFEKGLPDRVKSIAVYGGVSINPQMKALQNVNVLVATPGRLLELVESNAVSISEITTLVLDEADKMLNMGFKEEMEKVFSHLPKQRQTLLFSATLNENIENIQANLLDEPVVLKVEDEQDTNLELINQSAYYIPADKKGSLLRYLLREKDMQQVLIFASTTQQVDRIVAKLDKNGIFADSVHGNRTQFARQDTLSDFKMGRLRILVTTDLLARGIDIDSLPYVINYELPRSPKDYIHRIGRTGRAENTGNAITFVSPEEEHHFRVIQKKMKKWVDRVNVDDIDLNH